MVGKFVVKDYMVLLNRHFVRQLQGQILFRSNLLTETRKQQNLTTSLFKAKACHLNSQYFLYMYGLKILQVSTMNSFVTACITLTSVYTDLNRRRIYSSTVEGELPRFDE